VGRMGGKLIRKIRSAKSDPQHGAPSCPRRDAGDGAQH
jgi:hypothetical protein